MLVFNRQPANLKEESCRSLKYHVIIIFVTIVSCLNMYDYYGQDPWQIMDDN